MSPLPGRDARAPNPKTAHAPPQAPGELGIEAWGWYPPMLPPHRDKPVVLGVMRISGGGARKLAANENPGSTEPAAWRQQHQDAERGVSVCHEAAS